METEYMPLSQSAQLDGEKDDYSREPAARRRNYLMSASKIGLIMFLALLNLALVLRTFHVSSRVEQLPGDFGGHSVLYISNACIYKIDSYH